jgi:hypothetical protein
MQLTPIKIETLLHIYAVAEPLREAPAIAEALAEFKSEALIRLIPTGSFNLDEGCGYELLPRGETLVSMLLSTPLPLAKTTWVDPRE